MLNIAGSLEDIDRSEGLHPGAKVLFNVQDEFEVQGIVEYDADMEVWLGRPNYGTRRDV